MGTEFGQGIWMDEIKNGAALLFSGGCGVAGLFDRLHLVTLEKRYLEFSVKVNLTNVDRLRMFTGKHGVELRTPVYNRGAVSNGRQGSGSLALGLTI